MKIIIACDGSDQSENALRIAANLPFKDSHFTLVNILPTIDYEHVYESPAADNEVDRINKRLRKESENLLEKSQQIIKTYGHVCESKIIEGTAVEKLLELSKSADLIVAGSRGLNPLKSFFLGSVSDALVRHAECSVLLYKSNEEVKIAKKDSFNLVVGYDDTTASQDACGFLQHFIAKKVEAIDLVSVMQLSYYYGMSHSLAAMEVWPQYKQTLDESLGGMQRVLKQEYSFDNINTEIVSDATDISDALNRYATYRNSDLLIVGSKHKNLVDRIFLGSVSNRLAHHAQVPLLIVR